MPRRVRVQSGPRYAPAKRLDSLKSALAARRMSFAEMLDLLGVSKSTLKRMLRALETTDPICEDTIDGRKVWWIERSPASVSVRFTPMQMVSLRLASATR